MNINSNCSSSVLISCSARQKPTGPGVILQLSTHSITSKSCAVLAKLLTTDRAFCDIKLSDCMLPEDGNERLLYYVLSLSYLLNHLIYMLKGAQNSGGVAEG